MLKQMLTNTYNRGSNGAPSQPGKAVSGATRNTIKESTKILNRNENSQEKFSIGCHFNCSNLSSKLHFRRIKVNPSFIYKMDYEKYINLDSLIYENVDIFTGN